MANNKQTASQYSALIRNAQLPDSIDPELMADALDAILDEIPSQPATTEKAGLMSPDDKARLADAITETDVATHEKAGLMPVSDKKRLDGTECVVSIDDVVSHINLNTSNYVLPSTDDVNDQQATAPDGCELVYSTQDARLYARKPYLDGYMWYYYPQGRDLWGEPNPEVAGKGILARAGYLFVCNNPASEHNGKLFVSRYVMRADGRKGTQLVRMPFASEIPTPQSKRTATAEDKMYVYCVDNPDRKQSVLNAPDTLLRQANGKLKFQKGIWNSDGGSVYYTVNEIPCATAGADGAMAKEVFNRLGAGTNPPSIYETATSTQVTITYPNWALGGTRTCVLSRATSARAGMMSKDDKIKLDALPTAVELSANMHEAIRDTLEVRMPIHAFDKVYYSGTKSMPSGPELAFGSGVDFKLVCEFEGDCVLSGTPSLYGAVYISYNDNWLTLPVAAEDIGGYIEIADPRLCWNDDNTELGLNPAVLFRIYDDDEDNTWAADGFYLLASEKPGGSECVSRIPDYHAISKAIPKEATATKAGLMSAAQFLKLNALPSNDELQATINALQTQLQEVLSRIAALEG